MKKTLLLLFLGICFAACARQIIVPEISGRYELRARYGGFAYRNDKFPAGNGEIYQFNSDGTYVRYSGTEVISKGKFQLDVDPLKDGSKAGRIIFDNEGNTQVFRMRQDTITIGTTVTDQIASDYVRIK